MNAISASLASTHQKRYPEVVPRPDGELLAKLVMKGRTAVARITIHLLTRLQSPTPASVGKGFQSSFLYSVWLLSFPENQFDIPKATLRSRTRPLRSIYWAVSEMHYLANQCIHVQDYAQETYSCNWCDWHCDWVNLRENGYVAVLSPEIEIVLLQRTSSLSSRAGKVAEAAFKL